VPYEEKARPTILKREKMKLTDLAQLASSTLLGRLNPHRPCTPYSAGRHAIGPCPYDEQRKEDCEDHQ
jgi:hypothetical protein